MSVLGGILGYVYGDVMDWFIPFVRNLLSYDGKSMWILLLIVFIPYVLSLWISLLLSFSFNREVSKQFNNVFLATIGFNLLGAITTHFHEDSLDNPMGYLGSILVMFGLLTVIASMVAFVFKKWTTRKEGPSQEILDYKEKK